MIAKSEWFTRRKYTGWGLSPKSWQGYAYVIAIAALAASIQALPIVENTKIIFTIGLVVFILIDVLQVMASLHLDEREQKIEAISERNASWTMVASTVLVILYTGTIGRELKGIELMPILILPVITGVIAKGLSNYILENRGV